VIIEGYLDSANRPIGPKPAAAPRVTTETAGRIAGPRGRPAAAAAAPVSSPPGEPAVAPTARRGPHGRHPAPTAARAAPRPRQAPRRPPWHPALTPKNPKSRFSPAPRAERGTPRPLVFNIVRPSGRSARQW